MKALLLVVLAVLALPAGATEYLSLRSAQAELFPAATHFREQKISLSRAELDMVLAEAGSSMRGLRWRQWQAWRGDELLGHVLSDAMIGKHELFDYAVAFDRAGRVQGVRVLTYRETQGGEVRALSWLAQFEGRSAGSPLRVGQGIDNISGATLSCKHLTDGIRRLAFYARRHLATGGGT